MPGGKLPMRTCLPPAGRPGAPEGLQQPERPALAEPLTPLGCSTAQIGMHHLGDRNRFVPTVHGFDELLANLTHLNVAEVPASRPTAHVTTRRWHSSGGRRLTSTRQQMLNWVPPAAPNGIATKESTAL
jgi:arylsulfatase A-like enzyme